MGQKLIIATGGNPYHLNDPSDEMMAETLWVKIGYGLIMWMMKALITYGFNSNDPQKNWALDLMKDDEAK